MTVKLENSLISEWRGYKGRPFLISGPCSAETEEQVMDKSSTRILESPVAMSILEKEDR